MIKRKHWEIFYKAVLLVLVFLLASEPVLVAAEPQYVDPREEAIDAFTASGDDYLSSSSEAVWLSTQLINAVSAIRATPLAQLSDNALSQTRGKALAAAESGAIALGSIDNLSDSIQAIGGNLPAAFDALQRAREGLPQQLKTDLIEQGGLASADVDAISNGLADPLLDRQNVAANGLPADTVTQFLQAGFTQTEINQIAVVTGTYGLADTSLTTALDQFRASQDEWANVRTQMLVLNIQLMGYQIGARQAHGIEPRPITDAELQEIAEDELRLLIHVAHLQELWGIDPNLNVGEGDWWFIEHYASRAAERLDDLVIESQNRGLVQDLFVLQEMHLLALSARHGDADYVKTELDGLGDVLSYLVGDETFISRQRDELNGLNYFAARLASQPSLREKVKWPVPQEARSGAAKVAQVRLNKLGVQNLVALLGTIQEYNESNNTKSLVFVAGISQLSQAAKALLQQIISISAEIGSMQLVDLIQAILTGDTDNPLLMSLNMMLGMIPVLSVITDLFALIFSDGGMFIKAILLFALFCDIGETLALIPGLQEAAIAYIGGAVSSVVKVLFNAVDSLRFTRFKGVLNGLQLTSAFHVVWDLVKVIAGYITTAIHSLNDAIQVLQNILSGGLKLWDDFVFFVNRAGADLLMKWGFDESSLLVGHILRLLDTSLSLTDEGLVAMKSVTDDLVAFGVDLSDEAAQGLGRATKMFGGDELKRFTNKLINTCSLGMGGAKVAQPALGCNPDLLENILTSLRRFDNDTFLNAVNVKNKVGLDNFGTWMENFAKNPDQLADATMVFKKFGKLKNIDPQALNKAMSQGPEAVKAFSYWDDVLLDGKFEVELAERAGKDVKVIEELRVWANGGIPNMQKIAENSVHGSGSVFIIGKSAGANGFDGGYVAYARAHGGMYYHSHPEVYNTLKAIYGEGTQALDDKLWEINRLALNNAGGPVGSGTPFKYVLPSDFPVVDLEKEEAAIDAIWRGGTDEQIDNAIKAELGLTYVPGRMKELKLLFRNAYEPPVEIADKIFNIMKP